MKKAGIIITGCMLWLAVSGQSQPLYSTKDTSAESAKIWDAKIKDLYDVGVVMSKDSIRINEESRKIILDSNYRKVVYPTTYMWNEVVTLLKANELKKGFWYLINIYGNDTVNNKLVIESLVPYEQVIDMKKALISIFYSYALLDSRFCTINNGKPLITRPDMLEKKFGQLKEIIAYIDYFRKLRKGS